MKTGGLIKDQLHERLREAIKRVGPEWKNRIIACHPEYDSKAGVNRILYADRSHKGTGYCGVDTLKEVTTTLEKIAGIDPKPIEV